MARLRKLFCIKIISQKLKKFPASTSYTTKIIQILISNRYSTHSYLNLAFYTSLGTLPGIYSVDPSMLPDPIASFAFEVFQLFNQ